jgi:hypothetical protein
MAFADVFSLVGCKSGSQGSTVGLGRVLLHAPENRLATRLQIIVLTRISLASIYALIHQLLSGIRLLLVGYHDDRIRACRLIE